MKFYLFSLILALALFNPSSVFAGFIQIDVDQTIEVIEESKTVKLTLSIVNNGDESAKSLTIDLPKFGKSIPVKELVNPKDSIEQVIELSFEELNILFAGKYTFYYLVSYKDLNYYPFSTVRIFEINRQHAAPRAIFANVKSSNPIAPINLTETKTFKAEIKNLSKDNMTVSTLEPAHPSEILLSLEKIELPLLLEPGQAETISVNLENAGALQGSNYAMGIIISGLKNDIHFSELFHFRTKVVPVKTNPRNIFQSIILAVAGMIILFWIYKSFIARPKSN